MIQKKIILILWLITFEGYYLNAAEKCAPASQLFIDIDLPRQNLSLKCSDGVVLVPKVTISSGTGRLRSGQFKDKTGKSKKYTFCGRTDGSPFEPANKKEERKTYKVGPGTVKDSTKSSDFNVVLKNIIMIDPNRGTYIHAAPAGTEKQLGTPASAGCVRVSAANSKKIIDIVRAHASYGVKVIGQAPTTYKQCEHKVEVKRAKPAGAKYIEDLLKRNPPPGEWSTTIDHSVDN